MARGPRRFFRPRRRWLGPARLAALRLGRGAGHQWEALLAGGTAPLLYGSACWREALATGTQLGSGQAVTLRELAAAITRANALNASAVSPSTSRAASHFPRARPGRSPTGCGAAGPSSAWCWPKAVGLRAPAGPKRTRLRSCEPRVTTHAHNNRTASPWSRSIRDIGRLANRPRGRGLPTGRHALNSSPKSRGPCGPQILRVQNNFVFQISTFRWLNFGISVAARRTPRPASFALRCSRSGGPVVCVFHESHWLCRR